MQNFSRNTTEKAFSETLSILTDFSPDCRILVGFSGGCDSLALLTLLCRTIGSARVCAVYVNHLIRPSRELDAEIELNSRNCSLLGIKLIVRTVDSVRLASLKSLHGLEAAARSLRYEILQNCLSEFNCSYLATAHHSDDQIETLLMRVLSNSPLNGFKGIAESKPFASGMIIRPLLEFRKKELSDYLTGLGMTWSTDSTNSDNSYKRNEIRNQIVPYLGLVMPDYEERLLAIRSLAFERCAQKGSAEERAQRLYGMWDDEFDSLLPQSLIRRVLRAEDCGKNEVISSNGGTFCVHDGRTLLINPSDDVLFSGFSEKLPEKGFVKLPFGAVYVSDCGDDLTLRMDSSRFNGTAYVRFLKDGDRIVLKDGTKRVSRLLQDMRIPSVLRSRVPLIVDNDGVCAVLGREFGGRDRLCAKMRTCLARFSYYRYIHNQG